LTIDTHVNQHKKQQQNVSEQKPLKLYFLSTNFSALVSRIYLQSNTILLQ